MSDEPGFRAPTALEIQRMFRSPTVRLARPFVRGGVRALGVIRGYGWSAVGLEHVLSHSEPLVFAANHMSHADTAAILGVLPARMRRRTAVAAALDVFGPCHQGSLKRWLAKECLQVLVAAGFHAFAFDRHGPPLRSVRTSVQLIREGWNLLLYPEGTRSRTGQMAPFKAGVGVLARFTARPVVPIHVSGGLTVLPHDVGMPRAGRMVVRFGAPMIYSETTDTPVSFTARIEEQVRRLAEDAAHDALSTPSGVVLNGFHSHKQPA